MSRTTTDDDPNYDGRNKRHTQIAPARFARRQNTLPPTAFFSVESLISYAVIVVIIEGQKKKARYWGNYRVKKVAKLKSPVLCHSKQVGEVEFMPTIVQLEWEIPPSSDKNEFWFPYWIKIGGKEKYGQFAPMIGKNALLQLLDEAIKQDFFDRQFLVDLAGSIRTKLEEPRD